MRFIIYAAIWALIGLWSFIGTEYLINGWEYVRCKPNPHKLFISAMLMGPTTTLICFYTIFKYYQGGKK